jgi:hypothetical protein
MDTCKKVIISGNYKYMEEKINFLTSDDGSWCVDYEDEELMDMATLEFYNFKRRDNFIDFEIIKYPKNHPEQQQKVPGYMEFYKNNVDNKEGYFSFECEDKYIFFIFLSIIQKLGLV